MHKEKCSIEAYINAVFHVLRRHKMKIKINKYYQNSTGEDCCSRRGEPCYMCAPEGHAYNPVTGILPAWERVDRPATPSNHLELRWREDDGEEW
jgi:hypothetical protein